MRFLKSTFFCTECQDKTRLRVIRTSHGSYLPIEIERGIKIDFDNADEFFDPKIHKSHLLNCPGLAKLWKDKTKKFRKIERDIEKAALKMVLR